MGRQILINATSNDIRKLIASVKTEYPTLCRLEIAGREMIPIFDDWDIDRTFYVTTIEVYQVIKAKTVEFDREYPSSPWGHVADFKCQCVEIRPSIIKRNHLISGCLDPAGRLYANVERIEPVDKLYSCFLKHAKRTAIKKKNLEFGYLLYSFPEANEILKKYLSNEEIQGYNYRIILPANFAEWFSE